LLWLDSVSDNKWMRMKHCWNDSDRGDRSTTSSSTTLSTTNPTQTGLEFNPALRGKRPATNRLSCSCRFKRVPENIKHQHGVKTSILNRECKQKNLYLLGLLTLLIVVVFQNEPNLSENASVYIFTLTKLESNVSTFRSSRQNQSQFQDVFVIERKLVFRHYYKAQKRSNTMCNMSSSEASLRTNQSFVCVKTHYCPIVPTSACSLLHPGLWPDSSSFANLYRMFATSAKRVSQSN
jgi:hypothetical protein